MKRPVVGLGPGSFRAREALVRAEALYTEAIGEDDPGDHFRTLYLAALRGASAVIEYHTAEGAITATMRRRSRNAWVLLGSLPGQWSQWAAYFAGFSGRRAAVEAGAVHRVTEEDAEELFRSVGQFLDRVQELLGPAGRSAASKGVA